MARPIDTVLDDGAVVDGKYEVLSQIGSGSFGRVYRARQLSTGQLVALKVMRFSDEASDEAIQTQIDRFEREMRLCGELSHPNVVGLVDSGESADGQTYAAFAFVPGQTLAEVLAEEGALSPREAIRLMGQVLDALAAAHRVQVVHRDVKPANIMVSGTGALRNATLLDLGLGGFVESRREEMRRLTGSREFAGTLDYAAPEQLFGASPSARSDLYSWGMVLFECLTGEHPFGAAVDANALLDQRSVRLPAGLVDHPIGELIARVMEPDPLRRDVDATDLMHDLDRLDLRSLELHLESGGTQESGAIRRQIVALSCRIAVDTTDFEKNDAALMALHEITEEAARHYSGLVASKFGERVVVYFGYPIAHENDARRAARAAVEIGREIDARASRPELPGMSVHVGIHAGPVIAREGSESGGVRSVDIVGTTSVIATRLDELAPAGAVLLSETAQRLITPGMESEPFGSLEIRGDASAMPVHRLRPGPPAGPSSRVGQPGFVDRERPLRQLLEVWADSEKGQAECVVIRGEPGIGKSRLLRELRFRIEEAQWLEGRCLEEWSDTPLRPIVQLLTQTDLDPAVLLGLGGIDPQASVPLLREWLGMDSDPAYPKHPLTPDREKSLLLLSLASVLLSLAEERPVVAVIEDLHWADPTTREWLGQLVQRINTAQDGARLLLLLSTREWAPDGASVIQLAPLTEDQVTQMVHTQLDGDRLPSHDVMRHVVERSDGVPLFVEEVTRVLARSGSGSSDATETFVPDNLEALLQARLDTLSESTREVTQFAAAIGRDFEMQLLREVTRRSDSALRESIDELVRAGIVLPRPTAEGERYAFRHALIRETAWNSMVTATRKRCHARIVDQLERDFHGIADDEPELIAHHLGHSGAYERAACLWHVAGLRALSRAAYPEGISCLEKGLATVALLDRSVARLHIEAQLLETLGMAYYSTLGYAHPEVEATFSRAEAICAELGQSVPLQTLYGIWGVRFMLGAVDETAVLVDRFAALQRHTDEPLAALYAHGCAGLRAAMLGDLPLADEQLELSTRECESFANSVHLARLPYGGAVHPPAWWSWVLTMRGKVQAMRDAQVRMDAIAKTLDKAYGYALAGHFACLVAAELDDVPRALELAERQIAFSTEQQILLWQLCSQCIRGWATAHAGDPASGLAELSTSLSILTGIGMRSASSTFIAFRAEAELLAGDLAKASASIREGFALAETSLDRYYRSPLLRIEGAIRLAEGRREDAERSLRAAVDLAREQDARWYALRAAHDLGTLLGQSGRREEGREVVASALDGLDQGAGTRPVDRARTLLDELG